jgi:hypothetical protein
MQRDWRFQRMGRSHGGALRDGLNLWAAAISGTGKFVLRFRFGALESGSGHFVMMWGKGLPPLAPRPILATIILPALRSGQIPLDDSDQSWQHRRASVASLRRLIGFLPEP